MHLADHCEGPLIDYSATEGLVDAVCGLMGERSPWTSPPGCRTSSRPSTRSSTKRPPPWTGPGSSCRLHLASGIPIVAEALAQAGLPAARSMDSGIRFTVMLSQPAVSGNDLLAHGPRTVSALENATGIPGVHGPPGTALAQDRWPRRARGRKRAGNYLPPCQATVTAARLKCPARTAVQNVPSRAPFLRQAGRPHRCRSAAPGATGWTD